jgi:hypothetical protein
MDISSTSVEIEVTVKKPVPALAFTFTDSERAKIARRIMAISWSESGQDDLLRGLYNMFKNGQFSDSFKKLISDNGSRLPNVGEKVVLCIKQDKTYSIGVGASMREHDGETVTVSSVDCSDNTFKIEDDDEEYWYSIDMIARFV